MSTPLKILIADDETPARNRLRDLITELLPDAILLEAKNGQAAVEITQQQSPNLLLLDIRMPVMDGIEAAEHLMQLEAPPAIIFTTAYDAYAVKAFDLNAVDYLLKPIRQERLNSAISKAGALIPSQIKALKPLQPKRTHFSVLERGRVLLIPVIEVIYLRAELKYITIRTKEREYLLDGSLNSLEEEFGERFLRLHRNCLVAHEFITGYLKNNHSEGESHIMVTLRDIPDTVAVSRRQLHLLKELGI